MKSKITAIILTLSILCASTGRAEISTTLSVNVYEKGDGKPIAEATVVLGNSEIYKITDQNGHVLFETLLFEQDPLEKAAPLQPQARRFIKVLAQGYTTVELALNGKDRLDVYLPPVLFEGQGVTISTSRIQEIAGKISFDAEELTSTPGTQGDPMNVLKTLPGVVTPTEGSGEMYMRGSDRFDNRTVVNRIPIAYLYHFGGLRSTINPTLVSDLNIFLSNPPVNYSDALGGVVDVRLRDPKADRQHANVSVSMIEANFLIEGPGKGENDSYYFGARRSYFDLLFSPSAFSDRIKDDKRDEAEQTRVITVPRYYDAQGLYRHDYGSGRVDFNYFTASDKVELENRQGKKVDPYALGDIRMDISFQTLGFTWHEQLKPDWVLDVPVLYYQNKEDFQIGNDGMGNPMYVHVTENQYAALPELTWQTNAAEQWDFGGSLAHFNVPLDLYIIQPPQSNLNQPITDQKVLAVKDTIKADSQSLYLKQRLLWGEHFTSILGLRYTHAKIVGGIGRSRWMPRLGAEYTVTEKTKLTANVGEYVQFPQGFQVVKGYGNPGVEYNEAQHRSIGVSHKINSLWDLKVELYDKPLDNLVIPIQGDEDPATAPPLPPDNYANRGDGYAYGIDVYLKRERRDGVMGWLSYSYGRSERTDEFGRVRHFDGDQPHTLILVWGQPFRGQNWSAWNWSLKMETHTGAPYTRIIGREARTDDPNTPLPMDESQTFRPVYEKENNSRLPIYFRADLRLELKILANRMKAKLFLEVLNVTNRVNVSGYDYGDALEKTSNASETTGLPVFPFFGIEMQF